MSTTDDLVPLLKKLRMSGVLQSLELRTRQATEDDLSHAEFLLRLLSDEVERRDAKLKSRIRPTKDHQVQGCRRSRRRDACAAPGRQ